MCYNRHMATPKERKERLKKAQHIVALLEDLQKQWPKDLAPGETKLLNMILDARDSLRRATALM